MENQALENRIFNPPAELSANANAQREIYERAKADRLGFWDTQAKELVDWVPTRYPPVVCTTPFGLPGEPEV